MDTNKMTASVTYLLDGDVDTREMLVTLEVSTDADFADLEDDFWCAAFDKMGAAAAMGASILEVSPV